MSDSEYNIINKIKRKGVINDSLSRSNDALSKSYEASVKRITGERDYNKPFEIPNHVLKEREQFWNDFFCKYSTNTLDDTEIDIVTLKPYVNKNESLNLTQYWVNTSYQPYTKQRFHVDEDNQLETGSLSISEKYTKLSYPRVGKKSDTRYVQPSCNDGSSSSVDTTAYILSNMNTTSRAESMNIIEGAKHNIVISSYNASPMKITQFNREKICEKNNQNVELNDNNYNYQQDSPKTYEASKFMLQQKNTDGEENLIQTQMNPNTNVSKSTLLEINKDNDLLTNCESDNKFCEILTHTFNSNQNINSYIKQNSINTKSFHPENKITEGTFISQCNSKTKAERRKKLYTNRNSPVDLIAMKRHDNSIMDKSKQNLHPALNLQSETSKKRRRKTHRLNFSQISRRSTISAKNNTLSINDTKNSVINQYSLEYNTNQHPNSFLSINGSTNKNNKFNKSTNHSEKTNVNKFTVPVNVTESFNPTVHVKQLTKNDLEKYTKSKKIGKHCLKNMNPIVLLERLSTLEIEKYTKSKAIEKNCLKDMNPIVLLERLSIPEIEKYTKSKAIEKNCLKDKNPIVLLERLSIPEIEKYTRSKKMVKSNLENVDPVLSKFENQKFKNTRNRKALGKNDANIDQVSNRVSVSDKSLLTKINLSNEDDGFNRYSFSTCKCSSMSSGNYFRSDLFDFCKDCYESPESLKIRHILKTKKEDNKEKRKLNDHVINKEMKTVHQHINNPVLLSNKSEEICKNSCRNNSDNVHTSNDGKKSFTWLSFDDDDDDDEFDRMLNKNFSILTEKLNNMQFDKLYNKMKRSQKTQKTAIKSTDDQLFSKFITKDSELGNQKKNLNPVKSQRFLQQCNLSTKGIDKQTINETETVIINQVKALTHVDIVQDESLCFKTRIFDTDSDSDSDSNF